MQDKELAVGITPIAAFVREAWMHDNDWTWDIEASGLLDETWVDYDASPWQIKPGFNMHCVVFQNHKDGRIVAFYNGPTYVFDGRRYEENLALAKSVAILENYAPIDYEHRQMSELKNFILSTVFRRVVAHNQIGYDLQVIAAMLGIDFTIGDEIRAQGLTTFTSDTWGGNKVAFWDTLVTSKCLNPDRYGGHSLEKLASGSTSEKFGFRKDLHPDVRFLDFAADMLYYCIFDVLANTEVYNKLVREYGLFTKEELFRWASALKLEHNVAEIISRQQHRGFAYDMEKSRIALAELDRMMEEKKAKVEPLLPPRPATKKYMAEYTPPAKQIKKNGDVTSYMQNFLNEHGGTFDKENLSVTIFGVTHSLPMPQDPLVTEMPATINDTTHIKEWLVSLGWNPSEYKEKDLTVDTKKQKLDPVKLAETITRYVEQTWESSFRQDRLAHFGLGARVTKHKFHQILTERAKRSLKVLSNPNFTKGQDKDMCPDLERISESFPFAKDVVEYLTYRHRRNSILGGGMEWDDFEEGEEPEKGYIAAVRPDGRIPTPADTCGAATSRFKHRKVANIPRVSSLYGAQLRALFGVTEEFFQIGYDFDSLEARVEAAYCFQYDAQDKAYCNALVREKPFDVHTMLAKEISLIIAREFGRSPAKNVKYGCTYGAQAAKVAKTIGDSIDVGQQVFDAFWMAAFPLDMLKKALQAEWERNGKKFIYGIDGRRVPTRSAHAILNSLFQSGGVICAKRAMVIHDRMLKAEGLSVDFWKEDWKNKLFCQQMIAYHK